MKQKTFGLVIGIIFGLIALLHLLRIFYGWEAMIGGLTIPMWLSWIAVALASYLSYLGFKYSK